MKRGRVLFYLLSVKDVFVFKWVCANLSVLMSERWENQFVCFVHVKAYVLFKNQEDAEKLRSIKSINLKGSTVQVCPKVCHVLTSCLFEAFCSKCSSLLLKRWLTQKKKKKNTKHNCFDKFCQQQVKLCSKAPQSKNKMNLNIIKLLLVGVVYI